MRSNTHHLLGARWVAAAGIAAVAISCTSRPQPTGASADVSHAHLVATGSGEPTPDLGPKMAELRQATVRYHDFAAAQADGYTIKVTGCMQDAARGGMGYHYAKEALINEDVLEAKPEVLLYEPQGDGRLRLIGVEFIVPFTKWAPTEPPTLYGQTFARNETFQVWALHVWAWRENSRGIFADFNPKVSCVRDNA